MEPESILILYDNQLLVNNRVSLVRSGGKKLLFFLIVLLCAAYSVYIYRCANISESFEDFEEILEGTPPPPFSELLISEESLTRKIPVSHIFVASAYYYPTSKSLGENAIALNMVVDSINFDIENYSFVGSNGTHYKAGLAVTQTKPITECRYAPAVAIGNSLKNLNKLELESNGTRVEIPFKIARYSSSKPVIICISPQFVAEQWQIFLMHVHTAHRFGGHLHIYITSIVNSYFELMQEYERQGYLTMEMWLKMKFDKPQSPYFEPNLNTELGNQAGAFSDCLLQYKEAAEYIAFFDMEDVLFPLNYPTYLEEFNAAWMEKPSATQLVYGSREHEFIKFENLSEFNFHKLIHNLKTSHIGARRVVVKPVLHNTTWIQKDLNNRIEIISPRIIHVKTSIQTTKNNENKDSWKLSQFYNETIHQNDVIAIHDDIQIMKEKTIVSRTGQNLPNRDFYSSLIQKCLSRQKLTECPNVGKCTMPQRRDIKCFHTNAEYISGPSTEPFTFHFFKNPIWSSDYGCYQ